MATYALTINGSPFAVADGAEISAPANGIWRLSCQTSVDAVASIPEIDDEIVLTEDGTPIFGGYILESETHGIAGGPTDAVTAEISALDYNTIASRIFVFTATIPASTLKAALLVIAPYLAGYGVTLSGSQVDGPSLQTETFSVWSVQQVLDHLAELTGYVWRINASKVLSMFAPGSVAAPFNLAAGDGNTSGDVVVVPTRVNYANNVVVIGSGVVAQAFDTPEITAHGQWDLPVQAPDTTTQAAADALAAAILAASLPILKTVTYPTHNPGVEPGQTQTINLPTRGVNNTFLFTEVVTRIRGAQALRTVKAIEGLVYKTGWREQIRAWGTGGGSTTLPGVGGAGIVNQRYAYFFGASGDAFVESPTPDWVDASPIEVQINTVARGTTALTINAQLRALSAGVSVTARLFDVTAGTPVAGVSASVTSTSWTRRTWTVAVAPGSHYYRLQVLAGAPNEPVGAIAYAE